LCLPAEEQTRVHHATPQTKQGSTSICAQRAVAHPNNDFLKHQCNFISPQRAVATQAQRPPPFFTANYTNVEKILARRRGLPIGPVYPAGLKPESFNVGPPGGLSVWHRIILPFALLVAGGLGL